MNEQHKPRTMIPPGLREQLAEAGRQSNKSGKYTPERRRAAGKLGWLARLQKFAEQQNNPPQ